MFSAVRLNAGSFSGYLSMCYDRDRERDGME